MHSSRTTTRRSPLFWQSRRAALGYPLQSTAVNDVPVIVNSAIPVKQNVTGGYFLGNKSSDADGDTLTGTLLTNVAHGTLIFNGKDLTAVYTPANNYIGQDSFTYKVNDGKVGSAPDTVTFDVTATG